MKKGIAMNNVVLVGRLTKEVDTHQANDKTVARFTLAVDRPYKSNEADFISCVAFGKTAEFVSKYFKKGMKIALNGRIQTGSYTNRDGNTVYTTDVIAENVEFAESKRKEEEPKENEFIEVTDEEELPF